MKKNRPQRVDPRKHAANQPTNENQTFLYQINRPPKPQAIRRKPNYWRIFTVAIFILLLIIGIGLLFRFINQTFGTSATMKSANTFSSAQIASPSAIGFEQSSEQPDEQLPRVAANEIAIINPPRLSVEAAQAFARAKNAHPDFINLAPIFWRVAAEYQVDPLVVYCQSALETNFMHFSGVVARDFCNPCGLKTTLGGGDDEQNAHMRFPDWESGIRAQVQHLALYAGSEQTPVKNPLDPRHFAYLKGTALSVEALSQKWAPAADYGNIIRQLMEEALKYAR